MPNYVSVADAAEVLKRAERVLVVGCSGGGKTTLATKIAELFHLDYISVDRDIRWMPGWIQRDKSEQRDLIRQFIAHERWVMDGSGPGTFDLRLPRADLVLWVRVPRRVALFGLAKRVIANYGKVRFAMADGCPEPLPDREFLHYIWTFEQKHSPRFIQNFDRYTPDLPVCILRSHKEMEGLFL